VTLKHYPQKTNMKKPKMPILFKSLSSTLDPRSMRLLFEVASTRYVKQQWNPR